MNTTKLLTLKDLVKIEVEKTDTIIDPLRAKMLKQITEDYNNQLAQPYFSKKAIKDINTFNGIAYYSIIYGDPILRKTTPPNYLLNKLTFKVTSNANCYSRFANIISSRIPRMFDISLKKSEITKLSQEIYDYLLTLRDNFIAPFILSTFDIFDLFSEDFIELFTIQEILHKLDPPHWTKILHELKPKATGGWTVQQVEEAKNIFHHRYPNYQESSVKLNERAEWEIKSVLKNYNDVCLPIIDKEKSFLANMENFWKFFTQEILDQINSLLWNLYQIDIEDLDIEDRTNQSIIKIQEVSKLLLSKQSAKKFLKFYNDRINTFINHFQILDELLIKITTKNLTISPQIKKFLKINGIDNDFIGKWGLTLEDKDSLSLVIILENIAGSILNESKELESMCRKYLTLDLNKSKFGLNNIPHSIIPSKDRYLFDDINSYYITNYGHTFTLTNNNSFFDLLALNYNLIPEQFIPIIYKINRLFYNNVYPPLCKEFYQKFSLSFTNLSKKVFLKNNPSILLSFSKWLFLISDYYKNNGFPKLLSYNATEGFSIHLDKYLRDKAIEIFGFDFLSKNKWNLSNRIQLAQWAIILQNLIKEAIKDFHLSKEEMNQNQQTSNHENLLTQLKSSYYSLNTIIIEKPQNLDGFSTPS